MIEAAYIYGILTAVAIACALSRGRSVATAALIIGGVWIVQGALYASRPPAAGNHFGVFINATMIVMIAALPSGGWWRRVILSSLVLQIVAHIAFRQDMIGEYARVVVVNALYLVQLGALVFPLPGLDKSRTHASGGVRP